MTNRLTRSRRDKMIAGVCGGLAQYFEVDPTLVRLIFVVLFFASGIGLPLYIILWIVLPKEPRSTWSDLGSTDPYTAWGWGATRTGRGASAPFGAGMPGGSTGATAGFDPTRPGMESAAYTGSTATGTVPPPGGPSVAGGPDRFGAPFDAPGPEPQFGPYPWIEADLAAAKERRRPALFAMLLIGVGVLLLLNNLGFFADIPWRALWPMALIGIGMALLLTRRRSRRPW